MSTPNSREVQEFQFRLLNQIRVFCDDDPLPCKESLNLVAAASKYGLVFVSTPQGLRVLQIQQIINLQADVKTRPGEILNYPFRSVSMPKQPSYLDISCDSQYLATNHVVDNSVINFYDVASFLMEEEVEPMMEIYPGGIVTSMSWNPGNNLMLAICLSDGGAGVYEIIKNNKNGTYNSIPPDAQATCLCWSPKGKQIVIGSRNGTLNQFKPELKIVKSIPPPPSQNPLSVSAVHWLSNFQFAAVYKDTSDSENPVSVFYIVNTPKGGEITYICYEDICYSAADVRSPQYYIIHQQRWNVVLVASGNSMELGVLGQQNGVWEQWIQEDQYRAVLPLSKHKEDTFPIGMALDTSVQYNIPIGENQFLQPMPLLILISDEGLLSLYFVVNILPSAENICSPPELLPDQSGLHHFELPSYKNKHEPIVIPTPPSEAQQQAQSPSVPNWVSTANATPSSSQHLSMQGFLTTSSVPANTGGHGNMFGMEPKSMQPFVLPGTQVTITPLVTSAGANSQPTSLTSVSYSIPSSLPQIQMSSTSAESALPAEVKKPEPTLPQYIDISPVNSDQVDEEAKKAVSAKNDAIIIAAINEEVAIFNAEFEDMKLQHKNINLYIGSKEEKEEIGRQINSLEDFFKELSETTKAQKAEVHALKTSLLQTFNWFEDAKSRKEQQKNPNFVKLVKSQELDPVTANKLDSIDHLLYYIDSQIAQANKKLDTLWYEFQTKTPDSPVKIPTIETVYQTLVTLNNNLHKQSVIVDEIEERLATMRINKKSNQLTFIKEVSPISLNKDIETNELSKLAESVLKIRLGNKSSMENLNNTDKQYSLEDSSETKNIDRKSLALQRAFLNCPIVFTRPPKFTPNQFRKVPTTLSPVLPVSGVKPGGISSGQPIVTSSISQESRIIAKCKHKTSENLSSIIPKKEVQTNTQILVEIKNNLTPSFNTETLVKPVSMSVQKLLQTNLFENNENKPSTTSAIASMVTNQSEKSFNQPHSKFSFTSNDKSINKDFSSGELPKLDSSSEHKVTKPTTSVSSFTFKTSSNSQNIPSSALDPALQPVSPLSSLSNMVSGFVDPLPRSSPEKSTAPKISTNQTFQFSFSDPNKSVHSPISVVSVTQATTTLKDSVVSTNLFGGNINPQKTSVVAESASSVFSRDATPKSVFSGDTSTRSIFSGEATSLKSVFSGDTTPPKSAFSGDSTPPKSIFSGDTTPNKNVFSGDTTKNIFGGNSGNKNMFSLSSGLDASQGKNLLSSDTLVSDSTKSKNIFGNELGTTKSSSTTPNLFGNEVSSSQNVLDSNSDLIKSSPKSVSVTDSNSSAITTSNETTTNISKGSPLHSTPVSHKTVLNSSIKSSFFGAEPTIIKSQASTETQNENLTAAVTKEDSSQVESSSALFGSLNLGPALSSQTKTGSIFGGNSNSFGSSNIETNSTSKQIEESSNASVCGNNAVATTSSSSFNFGVAGASLFGGQSKPEQTPTTDANSLSFGQITVSATAETPLASTSTPVTTKPAFSFSLSQNTPATTTSTFSFAQAAIALSSTASDDKNTKISLTFGQPSATTTNSIFGGFNTQPTTTSSSSSIFGMSPVSTNAQTSFTFALPTTTVAQTSFFGNSSSIFGSAPATTTNSFFGGSTTTSSVFGQSSPTTSVFGQEPSSPTSSPFGSNAGFGSKSNFGLSGGSLFGQSPSGGFGSGGGTSMFGGGTSVFGSAASGSGGNPLFQSSGTGSIFGGGSTSPSGSFSSGGQSVSQTGFGSSPTFQNKLGGFGSAPTFGGAPAFGSPPKVFGSSSPQGGFGSPTQQSTAFESLANQNTMSFGNLAQNQTGGFGSNSVFGGNQTPQPQQQSNFTGSSFSGTSFSSWR